MIIFTQTESLSHLSPSILGNVGILSMMKEDVGWAILLTSWLENHQESDRDLLKTLCDQYIATIMEYLCEVTKPPMFGKTVSSGRQIKRMICQSDEAMIVTFTTILDVSYSVLLAGPNAKFKIIIM